MPTIKRLHKKAPTYRKKLRQKLYSDSTYRKERDWFMRIHPLCEECEKDGLLTLSSQCHHKKSPFDPNITEQEKWKRLRDENNFQALCDYHHRLIHHTTSPSEDEAYKKRVENAKTIKTDLTQTP